jgi:hypothetical protein
VLARNEHVGQDRSHLAQPPLDYENIEKLHEKYRTASVKGSRRVLTIDTNPPKLDTRGITIPEGEQNGHEKGDRQTLSNCVGSSLFIFISAELCSPSKAPPAHPAQIILRIQKITPNQSDTAKKPREIRPNQSGSHPIKVYPSPKNFAFRVLPRRPVSPKSDGGGSIAKAGLAAPKPGKGESALGVANASPTTSFRPLPSHSTGGISPSFRPSRCPLSHLCSSVSICGSNAA